MPGGETAQAEGQRRGDCGLPAAAGLGRCRSVHAARLEKDREIGAGAKLRDAQFHGPGPHNSPRQRILSLPRARWFVRMD